jgi:multimeric flavodoxin WrbA
MKIYSVLGAPRKKGNTEILWDRFTKGLEAKPRGTVIEKLILRNSNIQGCSGCQSCFETGSCTIKDDMQNSYKEIAQSHAIVLATPVYNMNMTGQLKCFIDRLTPFYKDRGLRGKKLYLLTTFADDDEEDSGLFCLLENLKLFCDIHHMEWAGYYGVSTGEGIDSVIGNEKALAEAYERALAL